MYKVLVIDDEVLAIRYLEKLIDWESLGCQIVGKAITVDQGTEIWKKENPDIIFMDIRMPKTDGLQLSRYFLEQNPYTVIILLTAYNDFEYARKAVKMGVFDFLVKHELTSELLCDVISRTKAEVDKVKQQRLLQSSKILESIWKGKKNESWKDSAVQTNGWFYLLTMSRLDGHIMPELNYWDWKKLGKKWNKIQAELYGMYATDLYGICLWFRVPKMVGKEEYEILFQAAEIAAESYGECERNYYLTVSDVFLGENMEMAVNQVRQMSEIIPYDMHRLMRFDEFLKKKRYIPVYENGYQKRTAAMIQAEHAELLRVWEAPFKGMKKNEYVQRKDMEPFLVLCRDLEQRNRRSEQWELHMGGGIRRILSQLKTQADRIQRKELILITEDKVCAAKQYIEKNYTSNPTAEEIAEALEVSEGHLRRIFREEMGCTVNTYLTLCKVEAAKKLLLENKYRMYEVSKMCGFTSAQYFSQVFRKITGMTPGELLERGGEADE